MSNNNGKTIKIISLIIAGVVLVGGTVASSYKMALESREYTDANIQFLREEQGDKFDKVQDDVSEMKQDIAVIRTIIEERFGRKK